MRSPSAVSARWAWVCPGGGMTSRRASKAAAAIPPSISFRHLLARHTCLRSPTEYCCPKTVANEANLRNTHPLPSNSVSRSPSIWLSTALWNHPCPSRRSDRDARRCSCSKSITRSRSPESATRSRAICQLVDIHVAREWARRANCDGAIELARGVLRRLPPLVASSCGWEWRQRALWSRCCSAVPRADLREARDAIAQAGGVPTEPGVVLQRDLAAATSGAAGAGRRRRS